MSPPGREEREVRFHDSMPKGYVFVPKGNVYITKNCRKKTHEADKTLYVVVDKRNKPIGLRCPANIYSTVMSQNKATAAQRAEAVQKRDAAIEENFEDAIVKLFPKIPKAEIPQIIKHSLKKHSRRVGRTSRVALEDRVKLAVRAHIRHVHTDYDQLLKQGASRSVAREKVWDKLNEVAKKWGGRALKPAAGPSLKEKRAKKSTTAKESKRETKVNDAVKKASIHTARVATRRVSKGASELSPCPLRTASPELVASAKPAGRVQQTARERKLPTDEDIIVISDDDELENIDDFLDDVDMHGAVFSSASDESAGDSDGSEWSNWSDLE
ncbi:hypothetical protein NEMBOFW57_000194 [Staphylotrichum longicolle]|uniref:DUF2293 domain-containing protein n=1 Tax=Staphylotrichum longicolle TaxID=669026 RepID=A0AAD4EZA9_9PEZI|nr:hypothetical protein NEMBOFW57_000194 [Staphylotrichum longicolle]